MKIRVRENEIKTLLVNAVGLALLGMLLINGIIGAFF